MRVTLGCLTLLCLGCVERADGAGAIADAADAGQSHDASDAEPGRLDVEWGEEHLLPEDDLLDCEVTSNHRGTFQLTYEAATRTLKDPVYDTVFDADGRPEQLYFRSSPGWGDATLFITITYDDHGQPKTSEHYTLGTTQIETEYDEEARVIGVFTRSPSYGPWRDE
ncbi:MAG TPA: hypothetical protein VMF89_33995, partial [Polyangiales bacterium]|nr:hypothetical protein [Polyangiales bacterium]